MKRRALWCLMLFLILCGCRTEEEPLSTLTPAPEVETAALTPTYTSVSVPPSEPSPSIAEQFQAAEGEDMDLWGGDLTASSEFLENSGYLMLKEPPQSVDTYSRSYGGDVCVEVFRDEWNMEDVVLITDEAGLCQEVPLVSERHSAGIGGVTVKDANFDGNDDLILYIGGERGGVCYYALFLWDSESESYYYEPSFSHITTPKIDFEHRVIWGGSDFTFGYYYHAFELIQGVYTETHQLVGEHGDVSWNNTKCVEYSLENGEMTKVGEEFFPDETYPVCAVEKYIESSPVWEGWSWCDPRAYERHG